MHLPSHNYFIVAVDVEEELNERLNGGNLGVGGDDSRYFVDTMKGV